MAFETVADDEDRFQFLNVFCAPLHRGWRIYVRADNLPPYLAQCFDRRLEATAMELDWRDLERYLSSQGAQCEKRAATNGCLELTARGASAAVLGAWVATALGSGIRVHG